METKSINGRICYKDTCSSCSKDRGFVKKYDLGKNCKSCSNSLNKLGKSSKLKGIKTGKPAHNRGKYFDNKVKKTLRDRMSRRLRHALSGGNLSKEWKHIFDIVGYSIEDLQAELQSKFKDNMNWNNIGEWHIDHILPESSFNYDSFEDEQFKKCWSLNNLQPLWAEDNIKKSNKIIAGGELSHKQ